MEELQNLKTQIESLEKELQKEKNLSEKYLWTLKIERINHYDNINKLNQQISELKNSADVKYKNELGNSILSSEEFMWLMVGSNGLNDYINKLRPRFEEWIMAGGKSWNEK